MIAAIVSSLSSAAIAISFIVAHVWERHDMRRERERLWNSKRDGDMRP